MKTTGALGAAAATGGIVSATPGRDPDPKENELLCGWTAAMSAADAEQRVAEATPADAEVVHRNDELGYMAVELPDAAAASAESSVAEAMRQKPGIRYVEENATHHTMATPDDDLFTEQYAPQQVRAPDAWDTTLGSENVTVAVVDQGVQYDHPDLEAQFGSDKGRDFVDDDGDPYPDTLQDEIHGTHVAGIVSATTDNGTGVSGVSNSTVISGRALSEGGSGSTADIADAVQWAADQGADIVNMSLGGGGYTETMKNAVSYAVNNGTLPICAAGNAGTASIDYPAAYDECVAVTASREGEEFVDVWPSGRGGSNYGPKADVIAPGELVLSTWPTDVAEWNGPYRKISGTSMACPAAAGVAALGKAANPGLGPNELRSKLKETAVDIGLSAEKQGAGRVDAANIVGGGTGNTPPTVSIDASSATVAVGETVEFDGSGSADSDGSIASYQWDFGDGTTANGVSATHAYDTAGDYTVSLTVTDDDGASSTDSVAVTVGSDGGNCGDESSGGSVDGSLAGYWDSASYSYTTQLASPCQVTVSLDGPAGTDFDLYVTLDGRTPTTDDYDGRSVTRDSQEQVVVEDVAADQGLGILVDSYSGSGSFTLAVDELGK